MAHPAPEEYRRMISVLATPLSAVRGIGPKSAEKFAVKGLRTLGDALAYLPFRHEDRSNPSPLANLAHDQHASFSGEILSLNTVNSFKRKVLEGVIGDDSGTLTLKWFHGNFEWIKDRYPPGTRVFGHGVVKEFRHRLEVVHPDLEVLDPESEEESGGVVAVYSEVESIHPRRLRKLMALAVDIAADAVVNLVPDAALEAVGENAEQWRNLPEVWRALHTPAPGANLAARLEAARRVVVLEEFFFLELALLLKKQGVERRGIAFAPDFRLVKPLLASLPWELTEAQRKVLSAIRRDMEAPRPMHRLLQGDVGSGKTVVALIAALMCIEAGYQAALMAPTEVLAEQHFAVISALLGNLGVTVGLLTGSANQANRAKMTGGAADGGIDLLIGTHALIQGDVAFKNLGLVIVDEQHRFGVMQRAALAGKGREPDLLVMTATPIPRSLSMTVYGDLDLTVIDKLPPGRKPVRTRLVRRERERVYEFVREEVKKGRQAYVVCPLVEETEKSDLAAAVETAEHFRTAVFPDLTVGLLHGRMKQEEKEAALGGFKAGATQVLVCTTVIEVGIDVPNATVMCVEHAERYGLSQLHQLRGRVGRGANQSWCLLLAAEHLSDDAYRRLKVMVDTEDGFRIAEEDLKIRGPGDMLGTRQSGLPDFSVANILRDGHLLETARDMAQAVLNSDPTLSDPENRLLRKALYDRWGQKLALVTSG